MITAIKYCIERKRKVPLGEGTDSGGILDASAKRRVKYNAQITLSAAIPAATTEGDVPRASDTAT